MDDLANRSREELETLKLAAEIEQLKASTEVARKPRGLVDRYALPVAAIVGGLSGLAALANAYVQFLEIDSLRAKDYTEQLQVTKKLLDDQKERRAEIDRLTKEGTSLQVAIHNQQIMLRNSNTRASQLKSALVVNKPANVAAAVNPAPNQSQVDLFVYRPISATPRGLRCASELRSLGYYVRSINLIEQGPKHDKIIYFWPGDEPAVRTLQHQLAKCGLSVPDGNLILVDPGSDYDTGKVAPRRAFEVWTSVGPNGTG